MQQFPMSTFARVFLERYSKNLGAEQIETVDSWEEKLCEVNAADHEAAAALERLQRQRQDIDQKSSQKRPSLEAFADQTPIVKWKLLRRL